MSGSVMLATAAPVEPASLTGKLTRHIRDKPVSRADLEAAAFFTLDALANTLAGRNSVPGRVLLDWWRAEHTGNQPADPTSLSFLAGALTHILETDDLHRESVVHPGCVVVPAAWALGTARGTNGKALLTAILHGFEACTRVGMGVGSAHYRIWHNTATCGPFGSAMAAAHLLGLDEAQSVNALGNAGSQAAGLWQFLETGAMTKHLHAGHAAEAGLKAAQLAAFGFTGPPAILEGEKGFFRAACPDARPELVTAEPDAPWQLCRTSIKPWPSCRHTHPAIDAGEELREILTAKGRSANDIETVKVETYQSALDVCDRPVSTTDYEAKFSLQHAVSAALSCPKIDFAAFGESARSQCAALAKRVTLEASDPFASAYPNAWGARVAVTMKDGAEYAAERTNAKGDPEAPLSADEMVAKARMLMEHGAVAEPDRLIEAILALPDGGNLPELNLV